MQRESTTTAKAFIVIGNRQAERWNNKHSVARPCDAEWNCGKIERRPASFAGQQQIWNWGNQETERQHIALLIW